MAENKYNEKVDPDGLLVTMETTGLSWCLDGTATWWNVDLAKLYYLTGLDLTDGDGVVTLTAGTLDYFPFDVIGSRNGIKWTSFTEVICIFNICMNK